MRFAMKGMDLKKASKYVELHGIICLYSVCSVFSKLASRQEFLSPSFLLYYGAVLVLMFLYAVVWQQVIKQMPLTTAYSNRAVNVIWGMIWGALLFRERLTLRLALGAVVVLTGVVIMVNADE